MLKKAFATAALLAGIGLGQAWSEVKLDTLIWADYSKTWNATNFTTTNVVTEAGGQFYISRVYVNLRGDIGKDPFGGSLKGRLTLDFAKPSFPVKYAYFDYKLFGLDPLVLSLGLLKVTFGNIGFWEYPIPVKDATEQYSAVKPTASADFGVELSGKALPIKGLTKNLLSYNLQLVNGNGYDTASAIFNASTTTDVSQFAGIGSIFLSPIDGTRIGFSYRTEQALSGVMGMSTNLTKSGMAIVAAASDLNIADMDIPVDFLFQYVQFDQSWQTNGAASTNYSGNVISASLGYGLFDKMLTPFVRYDMVTERAGQTNTATKAYNYNVLMLGLNYKPTKNLAFKPFYSLNLTSGSFQVMLESEIKLGFSIWQ